jgi:cytochrome c5
LATLRYPILISLLLSCVLQHAAAGESEGRAVYETNCRACHDPANVMVSSPKVGDAAEWSNRMRKGIEKVTDNAVDGIGAMPPKGGAAGLNREQIRAAILHMSTPEEQLRSKP